MAVVSDASPLITLSGVGLLSLLKDLFQTVHITEATYAEVVTQGTGLTGSDEVAAARGDWIHVHPTPGQQMLRRYQKPRSLTPEDASVIALAKELTADFVIIDERTLRRAAQVQGLTVVGTGGILIRAKEAGLISTIKEPLERASAHAFYLSEALKRRLLKAASELEEGV